MSLKRKITLIFLGLIASTMLVVGGLNHFYIKQQLEDQIMRAAHGSILTKTMMVNAVIDSNINTLLLLRDLPSVSGILRAMASGVDPADKSTLVQWQTRLSSVVRHLTQIDKNWLQISCLDSRGNEVFHFTNVSGQMIPESPSNSDNLKDESLFQEAFKLDHDGVYISPLKIDRKSSSSPDYVIHYAASVPLESGATAGVLMLSYRLNSLFEKISQTDFGNLILTDQTGTIIFDSDTQKRFGMPVRGDETNFFSQHPTLLKSTLELDSRDFHDVGKEQFRSWRKIFPGHGELQHYWILFSIVPEKVLFAAIYEIRNLSLLIGLVVLLLGAIVDEYLTSRITGPLERLRKGAKIIGTGNLDYRVDVKQHDEIGELTQAFNQMARDLKDITMAKKETLESLEKEKELSELKSRFVSMASHEFRTPLAGIVNSAVLISRYNGYDDEEKRARFVDYIKVSVRSLTTILNDFLSLDKLEAGNLDCHPVSFRLVLLLKEVIADMEAHCCRQGQEISFTFGAGEDRIFTDQDMLRNIMVNLISNATKYSPKNSTVQVSLELFPSYVIISVKDQGIGIPEKDQKHLFEKFFRAGNTASIQGTGLGLTIVKQYLDLMQGSVAFSSLENQGSLFTVILPREIPL